jgi:hypothetical protein
VRSESVEQRTLSCERHRARESDDVSVAWRERDRGGRAVIYVYVHCFNWSVSLRNSAPNSSRREALSPFLYLHCSLE